MYFAKKRHRQAAILIISLAGLSPLTVACTPESPTTAAAAVQTTSTSGIYQQYLTLFHKPDAGALRAISLDKWYSDALASVTDAPFQIDGAQWVGLHSLLLKEAPALYGLIDRYGTVGGIWDAFSLQARPVSLTEFSQAFANAHRLIVQGTQTPSLSLLGACLGKPAMTPAVKGPTAPVDPTSITYAADMHGQRLSAAALAALEMSARPSKDGKYQIELNPAATFCCGAFKTKGEPSVIMTPTSSDTTVTDAEFDRQIEAQDSDDSAYWSELDCSTHTTH